MDLIPRSLAKPTGFLQSALTEANPFMTTAGCLEWLRERGERAHLNVRLIPFSRLDRWSFNPATGNIEHASGKFFSIVGMRLRTNGGPVQAWDQPIIDQPEVGLLGIVAKRFNGVLYFLMQAKCEPGNLNGVQLSPTLQATKSNYTRVHEGKSPLYLEYFVEPGRHRVLFDQLQSEQGARFLRKRNRNIILEIEEDVPVHDDYCWLTLGQIKRLLLADNVVNMNARTVISGIPFGAYDSETLDFCAALVFPSLLTDEYRQQLFVSSLLRGNSLRANVDILSWFASLKARYELLAQTIPLNQARGWICDGETIHHETGKYFSVLAVEVEGGNREVPAWTQPMVKSSQEGLVAFITRMIHGVLHFLVQGKVEAGNLDVVEMAPSVQCITGDYRDVPAESRPPFVDYVLNIPVERVRYSALHSEEGGRFYEEQNRNIVIEADEQFPVDVPDNYVWMTLNQLNTFASFNNCVNVQARGLLATIRFL